MLIQTANGTVFLGAAEIARVRILDNNGLAAILFSNGRHTDILGTNSVSELVANLSANPQFVALKSQTEFVNITNLFSVHFSNQSQTATVAFLNVDASEYTGVDAQLIKQRLASVP